MIIENHITMLFCSGAQKTAPAEKRRSLSENNETRIER